VVQALLGRKECTDTNIMVTDGGVKSVIVLDRTRADYCRIKIQVKDRPLYHRDVSYEMAFLQGLYYGIRECMMVM
jgi:hypothetical protein